MGVRGAHARRSHRGGVEVIPSEATLRALLRFKREGPRWVPFAARRVPFWLACELAGELLRWRRVVAGCRGRRP